MCRRSSSVGEMKRRGPPVPAMGEREEVREQGWASSGCCHGGEGEVMEREKERKRKGRVRAEVVVGCRRGKGRLKGRGGVVRETE